MATFPIDDVRDLFSTDMHSVLEVLRRQVTALAANEALTVAVTAAGERSAIAESAEDGCHTITGSASLVGATALAGAAGGLRQTLSAMRSALADLASAADRAQRLGSEASARLTGFDRLLDLELDKRRDEADALAASLNRTADAQVESFAFADDPEPMVVVVPDGGDSLDPAVLVAFSGEAAELLDLMDRQALLLDGGDSAALAELMRAYHTLKGAANTVGLDRVGVVAHRVEDLLESIPGGQTDPALPNRLIEVQRTIRRWLARGGQPSADELAEALARIQVRTTQKTSSIIVSGSLIVSEHPPEPNERPLSDGSNLAAERRHLRVSADHLDGLMHLAGELVQGRSRLLARTGRMVELHRDLRLSRERLGSVIGSFRDRHEFGGLDGKGGSPAAGRTDPIAHRFTELELDRYEDIHILSRALGEVGNDVHEIQRQISQAITEVVEDAESFGRVVGGIQTGITRARLVPVAQLFTRLHLTARDAAVRLGKEVQIASSGEEVALDKGIIDGIQAAMLHLVRNAVAHGIEAADARTAAGKPASGVITLSARSEAGQILLAVRDDGGGLDLPALHRRGVALGLIPPATAVDSPTVRDLVFMPGLSTSAAANAVSGRGVGCDAARRDIQRLGGALTVTSTPGSGTVFTAALPLTLAITRALLLRHGGQGYAIPMTFVEHLLDLDEIAVSRGGGIERIPWGAQQLVLHDLGTILGLPNSKQRRSGGPALILHLGDQRWALRVDALSTQTDIVVSSLGELLHGHPLFSGVTITGAGELVPILDVAGLFTAQRTQVIRESVPVISLPIAVEPRPLVRVLVADDSVSVRTVMANQLRSLGAEVILAVDGEDALDRLRQRPVDLVLTDLEMPKMHGYDLIRSIRSSPAWSGLPVVVVTSRSGEKHRTLAMSVGASDFLSKPFTQEALGGILAKWVTRP